MAVEIEPGTYIIKVALQSPDPNEAAAIVNAVVYSYLDENLRYTASRDKILKASVTEDSSLGKHIERMKSELQELHRAGKSPVNAPPLNANASNTADDGALPTLLFLGEQQVNKVIGAMVQTDLDLLAAWAELVVKREGQKECRGMRRKQGKTASSLRTTSKRCKGRRKVMRGCMSDSKPPRTPTIHIHSSLLTRARSSKACLPGRDRSNEAWRKSSFKAGRNHTAFSG